MQSAAPLPIILTTRTLGFWCASRLASNRLILPRLRATLQCQPAHHQHHRRISKFCWSCPHKHWDFGVHPDSPQTGSYCPDLERPSSATQPTSSTIAGSANFAGADLPPPACKQDWAVQRQAVGTGGGRKPRKNAVRNSLPASTKDLAVRCQAVGKGGGVGPQPP